MCASKSMCVLGSERCDGKLLCNDGSDEVGCPRIGRTRWGRGGRGARNLSFNLFCEQVRVRNYARSGYNRISRELEREIREKERARVERERINMREKMIIREDEGNGKVAAEADARLCNLLCTLVICNP